MKAERFELLLADRQTGRAEILLETSDEDFMAKLRDEIASRRPDGTGPSTVSIFSPRRGPKGKAVIITDVEEGSGTSLRINDRFDTASDLSVVLGYTYNVVSMELARAKKIAGSGDRATLKGITFCYLDDFTGKVG
jgi:hypothetical protein